MDQEYMGEAITVVSKIPHFFSVSVEKLNASTSDPFGMIPYAYRFNEVLPNTNEQLSFIVKITSKLMEYYFKELNSNTHTWAAKYGLKCIRDNPTQREFTFKTDDYEKIKDPLVNGGQKLQNEILEICYWVNAYRPSLFMTPHQIAENFLYSYEEINDWLLTLEKMEFLERDSRFTRHHRVGVSIQGYKINHKKIKEIEEELGVGKANMKSIVPNKHRYFHLIDTQTEQEGKFAFVLMPFKEEEFPQNVFEIFRTTVRKIYNINCVKVSDDMLKNFIENKIYTHIVKSEFVIAELSTENPNVIFELGQTLSLEKTVIPTYFNKFASGRKKLAFDYEHFETIFYDDLDELQKKLTQSLEGLRKTLGIE